MSGVYYEGYSCGGNDNDTGHKSPHGESLVNII